MRSSATLAALFAVLVIAASATAPPDAAAQSGYAQFAAQCRANGGTPYPADSSRATATCDFGSGRSSATDDRDQCGGNCLDENYRGLLNMMTLGLFRDQIYDRGSSRRNDALAAARLANARGVEASEAGRFSDAVAAFTEAVRYAPNNDNYASNLAVARHQVELERARARQDAAAQQGLAALSDGRNTQRTSSDLEFMGANNARSSGGLEFMTSAAVPPPTTAAQTSEYVLINQMRSYAAEQGWSAEEQTRLANALTGLGDYTRMTPGDIRDAWAEIREMAAEPQVARDAAARAVGPRAFASGWQSGNYSDCVIFAVATASNTPYGVVAARANEILRAAEWRSAAERADPVSVFAERPGDPSTGGGMNAGEIMLLSEAMGQVRTVEVRHFSDTLEAGHPIMVNLRVPTENGGVRKHQVVLTGTFTSGGRVWFEMINSSDRNPQTRKYIPLQELDEVIAENGIVFTPESGTTPMLLRNP